MSYTDRKEVKFLVDYKAFVQILRFIEPFTTPDAHAGPSGTYLVSSLYFDTPNNKAYWEKVDGEKVRKKIRIRSYLESADGKPRSTKLEIKKKNDQTVYKEKASMSFDDAFQLVQTGSLEGLSKKDFSSSEKRAVDDVLYLKHKYDLLPRIVIAYERKPFVDKFNPRARITFDFNVKYRTTDFNTENADMENYAIPRSLVIVEVKCTGFLPRWIPKMVETFNLTPKTVSKYCEALNRSQGQKDF